MSGVDLIQARREARLSQIEAAKVLGVSRRTYQRWEAGETQPPGWAIKTAAEILRQLASARRRG